METAVVPDLVEIIQAIVRDELSKIRVAEVGVVKAIFPHSSEDDTENYECHVELRDSGLELKRVPVATSRIGFASIPNEGDLVLVHFIGGHLHGAVITGRLYNDQDRPPANKVNEVILRLPPAKPDEQTIKLEMRHVDGQRRPREFKLEMPPKIHFHMQDHYIVARAGDAHTGPKLTLIQPNSSDGRVVIEAGNTRIAMDQSGDVVIQAGGEGNVVKIQPTPGTITVQTSTKVTVEAPLIELGQSATHPAVFGDLLLQYLTQLVTIYQTHVHPGEMAAGILPVTPAPPVPPAPPPTPSLLSLKVMEG